MSKTVVQHGFNSGNGGTPSITLGSAPTAGNLVIVFFGLNPGNSSVTIGGSWTAFESGPQSYGLYRYAQIGDTAALPAFATAGFSFWSATAYEITGVSGTFATDVAQHLRAAPSGSTSITTTAMTTVLANELGLIGFFNYDDSGSPNPSISAGWSLDETHMDAVHYGSFGSASQLFTGAGSTVQATITFHLSEFPAYVAMRFSGDAIPVTVNLTGVSSTGSAGATGSEIDKQLDAATSTGAVRDLGVSAGDNISVLGASALSGAGSMGLAITSNVPLVGAAAASARGAFGPSVAVPLVGVVSTGAAAAPHPFPEPFAMFPVLGLMRDTAVPAIAPMGDDPVTLIMPLPPSGPVPASVAVHLVGASAAGRAATITPFFNVSVALAGVSSAASAAPVAVA